MEYKQLQEKYNNCCQLVTDGRLQEAFSILQELAEQSQQADLLIQLENHRETYRNILRYSFGEIEDPAKKTVYYRLLRSVIELADNIRETIITSKHFLHYSAIKKDFENNSGKLPQEAYTLVKSLEQEQNAPDAANFSENEDLKQELSWQERQNKVIQLFNTLWLTDIYHEAETAMASGIIKSPSLSWYDKCMAISSITLGLQRYFDETKLNLLMDAYKQGEEQVWQRALIGLLISLYQYNKRLLLYPKIEEHLIQLQSLPKLENQVESIIVQFIKTRDTEKIAQKFRDEIIPEMTRIHTRIYDKLDMKDLVQDTFSEDKNPDWENVFQDSPGLVNKLEEFSMLQMEGSDVMLSTFSMLKQFDFFNILGNWFVPFYKENHNMLSAMKDDSGNIDVESFAEGMEKSSILCNSDKHSFCLNVNRMPPRERSIMVEMFNMEMKAMEEISDDDELLHKPTRERVIFTQYIQDLYRFNKLHPFKNEFYDIFSTRTDFHNTIFFNWLLKDEAIVRNIGEFFFEKGHFQDAIEVFMKIDNCADNFELWQKIAYSWQKLGNYQKALEYYLKADLTDIKKVWNIKKIALCYRRLGNDTKALEYYLEAAKLEPDNLQVQANLAHIYFDKKDFEKALQIYFKIEYLEPDNKKILRPIAWCSLMLGKLDSAKKYFERIVEAEGTKHDQLNLGHIEWCQGNKQEAIKHYMNSIRKSENDLSWFAEEFMNDSEILIKWEIDPVDISLMRDYLKILIEQGI